MDKRGWTTLPILRHGLLSGESERWGLGERTLGWLLWTPIVGLVLTALARLYEPLFRFLVNEDSLLEWLQFVGLLATMVTAGLLAEKLLRSGYQLAGTLYALLALAGLFIAGEEIAWGARLLSLPTPEPLARINTQHTTTVHNIHGLLDYFNLAMLAVGFCGSAMTWRLRTRVPRQRGPLFEFFVPPLFLTTWFGVPFVYYVVLFTYKAVREMGLSLPRAATITLIRVGEWSEFCLYVALATWMALLWLRQRRELVVNRLPQRSAARATVRS